MKKYIGLIIVSAVILINLSFGLARLSTFSSVDEPYWTYGRIAKFWTAIKKLEFSKTDINDKPGITVALATGPGYAFVDPMKYDSLRQEIKTDAELSAIRNINFSLRLPIYLIGLVSLFLFYALLKKIIRRKCRHFFCHFHRPFPNYSRHVFDHQPRLFNLDICPAFYFELLGLSKRKPPNFPLFKRFYAWSSSAH